MRSKTKTVNSFVANYIHFLDGQICHFIIEQMNKFANCTSLGTIHDCFYIKPRNAQELQCVYKAGLVMGIYINELNYATWILHIMQFYNIPTEQHQPILNYINRLEQIILSFRKEKRTYVMSVSEYKHCFLDNEVLITAIQLIQQRAKSQTNVILQIILNFLKKRSLDNYEVILQNVSLVKKCALFPDNE